MDKHKQRRFQRRLESNIIAQEQEIVSAANKVEDALSLLSPAFREFNRNGLGAQLECRSANKWEKKIQEWAFTLTKNNMQALYGKEWNDKEKKLELLEDTAQYLIAFQNGEPIGFSHFRFDMDYSKAVLYCYEIQVEEKFQRHGLGKYIMQLLELLAFQTNMRKVVLTVFEHNESAMKFYKSKMGYKLDETSPSPLEVDWEVNYEVLSKSIQSKSQKLADSNK